MSIAINSNFERDQYVASFTGQVNFVYSFPIFSDTYLTVYKYSPPNVPDDPTQKLTLGVDYTVTGVGEAEGGTIILTVGATIGDIITVVGTQPIDRESVFQDLNPFTVALNQQLNELTVMTQQTSTYWYNITPRYNFDELVSTVVRPFKLILPMLPDGHVWVGRGELGEIPDDIVTMPYSAGGGGSVVPDHPGMRPSIALWTGTDFVLTDSNLNIVGDLIVPTAGTPANSVTGFDDTWGAFHWPAHGAADRPATPNDGDTYYDNETNQFWGYINGVWVPFGTGAGGTQIIETDTTVLSVGSWVRIDNTGAYVKAIATNAENAEVVGVVLNIIDSTHFTLQQSGYIPAGTPGFGPFTFNAAYFLSDTLLGFQTVIEPSITGHVSKPVMLADGSGGGWVICLHRGYIKNANGPLITPGLPTDTNIHDVDQPGNDFVVGDWVRVLDDVIYTRALGDNLTDAQGVGVVISAGDPVFTIQFAGFNSGAVTSAVDQSGLPISIIASLPYYLSPIVAGAITPFAPVTPGQASKPCYISESALGITGWVLPQRPLGVVGQNDDPSIVPVHQVDHGFIVGDVLRVLSEDTYTKAQADSFTNSLAVGFCIVVIDSDNFILQTSGFCSEFASLSLTPATQYYLSDSVAGAITTTEPSTTGTYSKPMLEAVNASTGYILEQRPLRVPYGGGGSSGVIQVKYDLKRDASGATTVIPALGTGVLNGLSVTLTPTSSGNAVRINYDIQFTKGTAPNSVLTFSLARNGVLIPEAVGNGGTSFNYGVGYISEFVSQFGGPSRAFFQFIDNPNTTSPITYQVYVRSSYTIGPMTITLNQASMTPSGLTNMGISTMTCEEIAQ